MTREQRLWRYLADYNRLPGLAQRVENVATPGFFDVYGVFNGHQYWVELKAPKTVKFDVEKLLETSQKTWAVTHHRAGIKALFVFVKNVRSSLFLYKVGVDAVTPYFVLKWESHGHGHNFVEFSNTFKMELL